MPWLARAAAGSRSVVGRDERRPRSCGLFDGQSITRTCREVRLFPAIANDANYAREATPHSICWILLQNTEPRDRPVSSSRGHRFESCPGTTGWPLIRCAITFIAHDVGGFWRLVWADPREGQARGYVQYSKRAAGSRLAISASNHPRISVMVSRGKTYLIPPNFDRFRLRDCSSMSNRVPGYQDAFTSNRNGFGIPSMTRS